MATEVDDGELIECIKKFPTVYDKNHGDYRNKQSKMHAWINIGRMMGVSEELCEQRWVVLRNRYATELRNKKKNQNLGNTWRYSEAMSFLEEYISPRRTRSSLFVTKDRKLILNQEVKSEAKITQDASGSPSAIPPEALVSVEMGCTSPNNSGITRLRPIAPRPTIPTVTRLVTIPSTSNTTATSLQNNFNCGSRHSECKEKQEMDDEDILFGKSIGHTLKTIKNKKIKLQVKSEILSILAQHAE